MSIHPSLGRAAGGKQQKSVLKRAERIKYLAQKGLWKAEDGRIFGLPKIKVVRIKIKKEKTAEKPAEGAPAATPGSAPASAPPSTGQKAKTAAKK